MTSSDFSIEVLLFTELAGAAEIHAPENHSLLLFFKGRGKICTNSIPWNIKAQL